MRLRARSDQRLLDVLRDDLRLTGAKEGCGKGECGACTVLVDGQAVDSCLMMAYQADGAAVETIEGLADEGRLHPLQDAFIDKGGVQCGICIPGMVLAAKALLDREPDADRRRRSARAWPATSAAAPGYTKIFAAVAQAATSPRAAASRAPRRRRPRPRATSGRARSRRRSRSWPSAPDEVRPLAGGTDILVRGQGRHGRAAPRSSTSPRVARAARASRSAATTSGSAPPPPTPR